MSANDWAVVREEGEAIWRPCLPGAVEKLSSESRENPRELFERFGCDVRAADVPTVIKE